MKHRGDATVTRQIIEARAIGRARVDGPAMVPTVARAVAAPDLYVVDLPTVVEQIGRPPARAYPATLTLVLDTADVSRLVEALEAAGWRP